MFRKLVKFLITVLLGLGIALFAFSKNPLGVALFKDKAYFVELEQGPRIFFEPGMEPKAKQVWRWLDDSLAALEVAHGALYRATIKIYICANGSSFNAFTAAPPEWARTRHSV